MSNEASLGEHKRDRYLAGKAFYWLIGAAAAAVQVVLVYAAHTWMESRANAAVEVQLAPIVKTTADELAKRLLVSSYTADVRLHEQSEREVARRLAELEATGRVNRAMIEQQREHYHRLELMLREGFAKQGVQLSTR